MSKIPKSSQPIFYYVRNIKKDPKFPKPLNPLSYLKTNLNSGGLSYDYSDYNNSSENSSYFDESSRDVWESNAFSNDYLDSDDSSGAPINSDNLSDDYSGSDKSKEVLSYLAYYDELNQDIYSDLIHNDLDLTNDASKTLPSI